jgi:hypothetical protein
VQVPYDEGVAIHIGPESCAVAREGLGEALTGVRIGQPNCKAPWGLVDPWRADSQGLDMARSRNYPIVQTLLAREYGALR